MLKPGLCCLTFIVCLGHPDVCEGAQGDFQGDLVLASLLGIAGLYLLQLTDFWAVECFTSV